MKKILFLTGTRADYGKLKSLLYKVNKDDNYELHLFVTGMHMLSLYGSTYIEIEKDGFENIYKYVNQKPDQPMDLTLSNTIVGFSNYVAEIKPDLIIVHGDRVEALAGAIVGALNNIKVAHIEGGEISGTIDESIRHAITKFAHVHLVSNEEAKERIIQLGEKEDTVFVIGSPDIDIMFSPNLPNISTVKSYYDINFDDYAIFMYHPVTTEIDNLKSNIKNIINALISSNRNYVIIYPNNDEGSRIILDEFKRLEGNTRFKLFPSIRFEYFLTLLKYCKFMIGNSSAGVRETCVYGVPAINIGIRQQGRYDKVKMKNIMEVSEDSTLILNAISQINTLTSMGNSPYGEGDSAEKFIEVLENENIWKMHIQKKFIPLGV